METLALAKTKSKTDGEGAQYQCCFCSYGIDPIPPDPCRLTLFLNDESAPGMQQELFCHASCLKNVIAPTVPTIIDAI